MTPALSAAHLHEVAAWMRRWRGPDELVAVETAPMQRITVQQGRGRIVFEADAVRRLALTP